MPSVSPSAQLDKLANGLGADEIMSLLGLGPVIKARLSVTRILFTPAKKSFGCMREEAL
jgi:hypothetical protein